MSASKRSKYLFLSKNDVEVACRTAYELTHKFAAKHLNFIERTSSAEEVSNLFNNWLGWIFDHLPFAHVVRIIDCYLVEGCKIFYRVGFALIRIFVKCLRLGTSKWQGLIESRGLMGAFMYFCREIPVNPDALLRKSFRIRRFSRAHLQKTFLRTEVQLKANGHLNTSRIPGRTKSNDNLPTSQSVDQIQATSTTMTYKTVKRFVVFVLQLSLFFL